MPVLFRLCPRFEFGAKKVEMILIILRLRFWELACIFISLPETWYVP